jgi:uncharacterized protein YecE (DUF72 family)
MFAQGSLFADSLPFRDRLGEKLTALARQGTYLGTSSWKYEGWLGQIYTPERYFTRGRLSRKRFEAECLAEYGQVFPTVCGDFAFYQFPSEVYWQRLFASAPSELKFAFKVPEEVTCRTFPAHARYGARGGLDNPNFLSAGLLEDAFLGPLRPYRNRMSALIFEFGAFSGYDSFLPDLDRFLGGLPSGDFRYSVEVRNPELLGEEYFACLRSHGAAHVFNAWTRMPELQRQTELPGAFTADFSVVRALLRRGRSYEQAVAQFAPYTHTQEENPSTRAAIRALIQRERKLKRDVFIYVNNRLEGNAPLTIDAVVPDDA